MARDPPSGRVLGTLVYRRVPGELGDELNLHQVAVHPDARRGGLGRALVEHLLGDGRAAGAARVTLEVRRDNRAARALYERLRIRVHRHATRLLCRRRGRARARQEAPMNVAGLYALLSPEALPA